jgi:hypothetical protein
VPSEKRAFLKTKEYRLPSADILHLFARFPSTFNPSPGRINPSKSSAQILPDG